MDAVMMELCAMVMRAENKRTATGIPRVAMVKGKIPEHQLAAMYEPMINLVLQGEKTLTIGDRVLHYGPGSYFVISVDVPATGEVHQEARDKPYLAVALTIDTQVVASMLLDTLREPDSLEPIGFSVGPVTPELLDAWARLLRLMDEPGDIDVLAPLYEREVLYRVLRGPQGWMLREVVRAGSTLSSIRKSIQWLRLHYAEPCHVEQLAEVAGMSVSAFHRHFKAITALTPIQYQKQTRLLEARRLLLAESSDSSSVSRVALDVGYVSASQFSREYTRMFGASPAKDVLALRRRAGVASASLSADQRGSG